MADLPASQLFFGADLEVLRQAAISQLRRLLCSGSQIGTPCGECKQCLSSDPSSHLDVLWIKPKGAGGFIRVGAIAECSEKEENQIPALTFLRTRPLVAPRKVVVVESAEKLHPRAANALLKSLEEPHPYGHFVLLTQSISKILPTIQSRCICRPCALPSPAELDAEFGQLSEWELEFGEGSPTLIRSIRANPEPYKNLLNVLKATRSGSPNAFLKLSEQTRDLSDALAKATDLGARQTQSEVLRCVSVWLLRNCPEQPNAIEAALETHRRITGNALSNLQFDNLFAQICSK